MIAELKNLIEQVYGICDKVQERIEWSGEIAFRDVFKMDLLNLAMYISASDGTIAYKEARVISDYLDLNLAPEGINTLLRQNNIYSTEFENTVPLSLQIFLKADNTMDELGINNDTTASEVAVEIFKGIASEVANADGNIDPQEEADWEIYSKTLDNYLTDNLNKRKHGVKTGLTKNSGVAAPKKK